MKWTSAELKVQRSILDSLGVDEKPDHKGRYKSSPSPWYSPAHVFEAWEDTVEEMVTLNTEEQA